MKKIKKIKIKINGKLKMINVNTNLSNLLKHLGISTKKVAINAANKPNKTKSIVATNP